MILLVILFLLLAITGVYGGYHLILGQAANQLSAAYPAEPALLIMACLFLLVLLLPAFLALRIFFKHKRISHH